MKQRSFPWGLTSAHLAGPLALSLAILVLGVSEMGFIRLKSVSDERSASVQTQIAIGRLRRTLLFMESSLRGYMLTAEPTYLEPYRDQEAVFKQTVVEVDRIAKLDVNQGDSLTKLAELARRKHAEMQEVLRLHTSGQTRAALNLVLTDVGQQMMFDISSIADDVLREEAEYQRSSTELRDSVVMYSRLGIWLLVGLCVAGAVTLRRLSREQEHDRQMHLLQLLAERDRLDGEVSRATAETLGLAQHMERVREDERSRLARELHDELGGLLTSAKLDLARMRKRIVDESGLLQQLLVHLGQSLDEGISLKRRIIEDLRPSSLSHLGLQRTLEIQCAEFAQRAEISVECNIADIKLSPERALAVYRLVQEALTNVAKYANATTIHMTLGRQGDNAEVVVADDGVGFDPDAAETKIGHGLQGMRFRMQACGGTVQVLSDPGSGTTIKALVPI